MTRLKTEAFACSATHTCLRVHYRGGTAASSQVTSSASDSSACLVSSLACRGSHGNGMDRTGRRGCGGAGRVVPPRPLMAFIEPITGFADRPMSTIRDGRTPRVGGYRSTAVSPWLRSFHEQINDLRRRKQQTSGCRPWIAAGDVVNHCGNRRHGCAVWARGGQSAPETRTVRPSDISASVSPRAAAYPILLSRQGAPADAGIQKKYEHPC